MRADASSLPASERTPKVSLLAATPLLFGSPMISLVFVLVAPVLPKIAAHFSTVHDAALLAQMIMTAPAVGLMVGGPLCGLLVSRFGARPMYVLFLLAVGLLGGAGLVVNDPTLFLVSRGFLGFAAAGAQNAASTMIAERYVGDQRARLFGLQVAAGSVSAVLALVLAGALAQGFGWRTPAVLYFTSFIVAAAVLIFVRAAPPAERQATDGPEVAGRGIRSAWPYYVIMALVAIPLNLPSVQVGFQLTHDGVTSSLVQSLVIAAFSLTLSVTAPLYPNARARFGPVGAPLLATFVLGVGFLGAGAAHGAALTGAWLLLAGLGAGLLNPHFGVRVAETVDPRGRGAALGFLFGAFFFGEFVSPVIMAPLRLWLGVHGAFSAVGLVLMAAAAALYLAGRARRSHPRAA